MPLFRLPDGRDLEYEVSGPSTGPAVVFHHGMPGSADPMPTVLDSITGRGFRVITYSRAGYGASSPAPGRSVADSAADCVSLLAHLGIAEYLTVGWSTGENSEARPATTSAGLLSRTAAAICATSPRTAGSPCPVMPNCATFCAPMPSTKS